MPTEKPRPTGEKDHHAASNRLPHLGQTEQDHASRRRRRLGGLGGVVGNIDFALLALLEVQRVVEVAAVDRDAVEVAEVVGVRQLLAGASVSDIFSPCRMPSVFTFGSTPNRLATATARSPIVQAGALWTKMSPGRAWVNACSTSCTESASDIRNRVIVGSVTVSGWPARICSMNSGMTEPREYITLPYRTHETVVCAPGLFRACAWATFSMRALVMPIALTGWTALSVLRNTTAETPLRSHASTTLALPRTFVCTASSGKNSHDGTCFSAAAWNTYSTPGWPGNAQRSRTSPT